LVTYRDKLQNEIDEFDKWAKTQSDIHTQLELEAEGK
jgi:N12 class adenine-specific DNA methylase